MGGGCVTGQGVYRRLRELREVFGRPEGWAWPEISCGQLLVMMSPTKQHQLVAHRLRLQLESQLEADVVVMVGTDMEDAALGVVRVPDLVVIDEEEAVAEGDAIDPRRARLVIEIVSRSSPANDYRGKQRDYPAMGVPHYLIIDPREGSAVHYWAPTRRTGEATYDDRQRCVFGDTVTVAGWKIGTAGLPRYAAGSGW